MSADRTDDFSLERRLGAILRVGLLDPNEAHFLELQRARAALEQSLASVQQEVTDR